MELIYLYIEDDEKNIKDCEFNFTPEYRFSYDREKKFIDVQKNENHIPNFWGIDNITNITAIVGKNGVGKSNLLEFIFRYHVSAFGIEDCSRRNLIHIYRSKGVLYINRPDISSNFNFYDSKYIQYPLNDFKNNVDTKLLYYSSQYEKNILVGLGQGIISEDISTGGLLRKYGNDRQVLKREKEFSDVDRLIVEDTFRQLELLLFSEASYFKGISLPLRVNITFKEGANKLKTQNQLYNKFYIDTPMSELSFAEYLTNRFLYFIFKTSEDILPLNGDHENFTANHFIEETYAGALYLELNKLFQEKKIIVEKYPHQMGLRSDYPLSFSIRREDISFDLIVALYKFYFSEKETFADSRVLDYKRITHNELVLSWEGISAGELEYLNFLSRIYSTVKEVIIDHGRKKKVKAKPDKINNIILLLDEPERSFHPEWQRLFLENLLHFLNDALPFYTFQIVVTSHSPILISDFPKDNIIFLDKNPDGSCKVIDSISRDNTFGANIHTLYRNSFFIDGLPIGEFAKKKINKLFDELENGSTIRPTILKEILMIGEPILREQLMKRYKQREGLSEEVNSKISQLQREIEDLKRRLDDKN